MNSCRCIVRWWVFSTLLVSLGFGAEPVIGQNSADLPPLGVAEQAGGGPFRGPADAPVTIWSFLTLSVRSASDRKRLCKQILEQYPGTVKLVFRDFPLDRIHPKARAAAEAGRCARAQGKFWEYHDVLFARSPELAADDLLSYAAQVSLDLAAFENCLAAGIHKAEVQRDVEEGKRLGVTGTPAFFINGRRITGAKPLDVFTQIIDEELARARQTENRK